ncbi:bZIP transcription factor 17-like [Pyrus communis]|uniref:bZIP transcription factor 17-like n=1 Tax=Pyrus communis TaxID=23211 RepID=UPI0035C04E00
MALPAEPHSGHNSTNHPDHTDFKFNSEMESLGIPPLDPEFFSSDNGMAAAAVPSDDPFMSDLGFGFGDDGNCEFELTFDDLDDLYLPSEAEDFLVPDGLDPGPAALDSGSPESGSSAISVSGDDKGALDISRFLNCPASSNECSENSGGPASSQGSGISEAVDSNSHSGNSDDEKVKVEDELAKNYLVKRKKEIDEGNAESRSAKYRRSENNNNNNNAASVNVSASANDEDEKRKARLIRNRESAQLSRQRKKHYVEELEDKVRAMHSTIADLNNRISYVMAENATLKQQLSTPPPPSHLGMHPHPPMPPMAYPWMPYSPYVVNPQGSQSLLVPIPRLKSQQPAAAPKSKKSDSKKSEGRTKKVASISFLGLLFFILLFGGLVPMVNVNFSGVMDRGFGGSSYVSDRFNGQNRGRLLNVHGYFNGSEEIIGSGISDGKFDISNKIRHEKGHHTRNGPKEQGSRPTPGSDEFARLQNTSSEPLVASLYVPRNDKLVKIDGNLIIHSVLASEKAMASRGPFERKNSKEPGLAVAKDLVSALAIPKPGGNRGIHAPLYRNSAGPHKALTAGSTDVPKDHMKSTTADGKLQQWFREGLAGPMLSSGMCTEVFQFDVSAATSSGGIVPASSVSNASEHHQNTTELNRGRNRRILRGLPIPLPGSGHNVTEENVTGNQQNNTLPGNRSVSPMVVSVLVDPREAGDIDVDGMIKPKSLSRIFVVVLLDSVKYVTYSCVLPRSGPHLVTT